MARCRLHILTLEPLIKVWSCSLCLLVPETLWEVWRFCHSPRHGHHGLHSICSVLHVWAPGEACHPHRLPGTPAILMAELPDEDKKTEAWYVVYMASCRCRSMSWGTMEETTSWSHCWSPVSFRFLRWVVEGGFLVAQLPTSHLYLFLNVNLRRIIYFILTFI